MPFCIYIAQRVEYDRISNILGGISDSLNIQNECKFSTDEYFKIFICRTYKVYFACRKEVYMPILLVRKEKYQKQHLQEEEKKTLDNNFQKSFDSQQELEENKRKPSQTVMEKDICSQNK